MIHDDPDHPLTVYRVQDERGNGPHITGSFTIIRQDRRRRPPPFSGNFGEQQAFAEGDFDEADRPAFHALGGGVARFGFLTRSDATRWFGKVNLRKLAAEGFEVRPVLAARVWRSRSGRQVFFEPIDD